MQRLAGAAAHIYAPLDVPWAVRRVLDTVRPAAFLCVETELWPNLLRALAQRGVPAILVNGRLSSDSFRGYRLLRPFMVQVLSGLSAALMQTDRDVERLIALGAVPERVRRVGNIKFDQPLPEAGSDGPAREAFLHPGERLIVAGSTHAGEEDALLQAYHGLIATRPGLVLLLAPRHIERAADVAARAVASGLPAVRRSAGTGPGLRGPRVIVLDTRGELASVYRHAAVAYVGGTLVPIGGHNLLEPAQWSKPVIYGTHTDHCAEVARLLSEAGGGRIVADAGALERALGDCLDAPAAAELMGRAARQVVEANRGAIERSVAAIEKVLNR
jgi:3-deoxy-D-manno-octulosonic-acid transferase